MSVFGKYSSYYNLLYKDKDYAGEVDYIHNLIQKYNPGAKSILDLGCGTGQHDFLLAERGHSITGVDQSEEMLSVASSQLSGLRPQPSALRFAQGDIRSTRLNEQFDAVISLFHVISYQATNDDLQAAFATAKAHLKPGGIFVFDCWYGPAVLTDRPVVRVKRLDDENISVTRIAEPVMHPNESLVDVNYHVFIRDKSNDRVEELKETHRMRYLFKPEIEIILTNAGLEFISCEEWLTGKEPGFKTWGICCICRNA